MSEATYLREAILALLIKHGEPQPKFVLGKQCRDSGVDPDSIALEDLKPLSDAIHKAFKKTDPGRANRLRLDILKLKEHGSRILALEEAGDIFYDRNKFEDAIKAYETASTISQVSKSKQAELKRKAAEMYSSASKNDEAILVLKEAEEVAKKIEHSSDRNYHLARIYTYLMYVAWKQGNSKLKKSSESKAKAALGEISPTLRKQAPASFNKANAWFLLESGIILAFSDNEAALKNFEDSSKMFKEAGDSEGRAIALNNLGAIYSDLPGEEYRAIKFYEKSIKLREKTPNKYIFQIADTRANLAETLALIGNLDKAEAAYRKAMDVLEGSDYSIGLANLHRAGGIIHTKALRWEDAVEEFEKARSILESKQLSDYLLAETYLNYATMLIERIKAVTRKGDWRKRIAKYQNGWKKGKKTYLGFVQLLDSAMSIFEEQENSKKVATCQKKLESGNELVEEKLG